MEDNEVRISLEEYLKLRCKAGQFDIITKLFFDNLELSYNKKELYSNAQQQLLAYLRIIKPNEYDAKLKELISDFDSQN